MTAKHLDEVMTNVIDEGKKLFGNVMTDLLMKEKKEKKVNEETLKPEKDELIIEQNRKLTKNDFILLLFERNKPVK
jgi:hypothetical protein